LLRCCAGGEQFESYRTIQQDSNIGKRFTYTEPVIEDVVQPVTEELDLPAVLGALADPGRLAVIRTLADAGEESCARILEESGLGYSKSTMSHHLKVLREAGLTRTRVEGARRYVSLRRGDLDARFPGLLDAVLGTEVRQA
jgi:DNA-binding transcriptional ArsR family regulator